MALPRRASQRRKHGLDGRLKTALARALDRNYAAHFAFIAYLFGTAAQSGRRFPEKYGVLGDYIPQWFLKQQMFPLTWKGRRKFPFCFPRRS